ncbi:MAG: carbohydrate kinase [Micromonosporaceae bacterium]|nr:carbohydrate kinase [Micromonosporaceae bacterium]
MGVDLGTQSVRAALVADDGAVLGNGAAPLQSRRWPDGRHEQDPESWWRAVADASRQALDAAGPADVAGVACCGTSGTVLLVEDAPGDPARPLTPGLMYDDARAADEALRVARDPAPVWAKLGLSPQRTWALPKALWLVRHAAPPAGPTARLAHQVDLVTSRLVGRPTAADTSHALKTGADPLAGVWPEDDLARLGLDPAILPPLARPGTVLGHVCADAAERTGVRQGVPVVAGMTDGCAAQIAAGVLSPGEWSFAVGTTTVLKGVSAELPHDPTGALYSHRSPDGLWWPGGASSAGAGLLSHEFKVDDFPELERLAAAREPASCVMYPLVSAGERFPFRRTDATRLTLGEPADDADRFAAILQGVGYVQRLCLDHLRALGADVAGRVTVTGGATRSAYWPQLMADILRREVGVPRYSEGALGMAVLAASAEDGLVPAAARMTGPARVHHPRAGADFNEPYERLVAELHSRGWIGASLAAAATRPAPDSGPRP